MPAWNFIQAAPLPHSFSVKPEKLLPSAVMSEPAKHFNELTIYRNIIKSMKF